MKDDQKRRAQKKVERMESVVGIEKGRERDGCRVRQSVREREVLIGEASEIRHREVGRMSGWVGIGREVEVSGIERAEERGVALPEKHVAERFVPVHAVVAQTGEPGGQE